MQTKYQPLVDYIAEQAADTVTLSFAAIAAIVGGPLSETMQVDAWMWNSPGNAVSWRLHASGWHARLDRRNGCVIFTRAAGVER